jgi:hypothetical protein
MHQELHNRRRYKRQAIGREEIMRRIRSYKLGKSCVDCGESDPIVLEFDHVRGEKRADIGRMSQVATWAKIEDEIAKCELRCANCHRRKTARQFNWKVTGRIAET